MTFEQLAIFVAVAEREHLTHAAEAIHLTPSAVSSAIKNLEAYYGVELFHRVGRRIELTDTGRSFLGEARATLAPSLASRLAIAPPMPWSLVPVIRATLPANRPRGLADAPSFVVMCRLSPLSHPGMLFIRALVLL